MKVKVLGCGGAELPGSSPPAFLLDDTLLLDAGTIGSVLSEREQQTLEYVVITHSHLDHVRGLPFLADNMAIKGNGRSIFVAGIRETLDALRTHLLNDVIWPDFSRIPRHCPVLRYLELQPQQETRCGEFSITPIPVTHSVPAVGYIVRKGDKTLGYTGDTGPTEEFWRLLPTLSALIVEVSFPNELLDLALLTGHLTPSLMEKELGKLPRIPPMILITHQKPQYAEQIALQSAELRVPGLQIVSAESVYYL